MSDPSGMTKYDLAVSRRGGRAPSYETLIALLEWSIWGPAWGPEGRARRLIKRLCSAGTAFSVSCLQYSSTAGSLKGDRRAPERLLCAIVNPTWRSSE